MFLEIVSPEAIKFSEEIESLAVPGINGEFQMLNMHAPVISILKKGKVKIGLKNGKDIEKLKGDYNKTEDKKITYEINSGILEINNNKIILLED